MTHALQAARTTPDQSEALNLYSPLLRGWEWQQVAEEIDWIENSSGIVDSIHRLINLWLEFNPSQENQRYVYQYLSETQIYRQWSPPAFLSLFQNISISIEELKHFPELMSWWLTIQAEHEITQPEAYVKAVITANHKGNPLSPSVIIQAGIQAEQLQQYKAAAEIWHKVLADDFSVIPIDRHNAHAHLAALYAPDSPLENEENYLKHALQAARTTPDIAKAKEWYQSLLITWDWQGLHEEIIQSEKEGQGVEIIPFLLQGWLKLHPDEENQRHVTYYLREETRYRRYETAPMSALVAELSPEILFEIPELLNWWLNVTVTSGVDAPEKFVEMTIKACQAGMDISEAVVTECGRNIFEQLSFGFVTYLHDNYFVDPKLRKRYFTQVLSSYQPEILPAIARWLFLFSDEIVKEAPSEAERLLEKLVRQVTPGNLAKCLDDCFELRAHVKEMVEQLLLSTDTRKIAHRAWLTMCERVWNDEIPNHLCTCLTLHPPDAPMAEKCLELLLQQEHGIPQLRRVAEMFATDQLFGRSHRIDSALRFMQLLDRLIEESDITRTFKIENQHLSAILRVFEPKHDIHQADMAAALLGYMMPQLNRNWLTPAAYYVRILTDAHRFEEALQVAAQSPGLAIGKEKETARQYIQRHKKLAQPKKRPDNESDYQRIVKHVTTSWKLFSEFNFP